MVLEKRNNERAPQEVLTSGDLFSVKIWKFPAVQNFPDVRAEI